MANEYLEMLQQRKACLDAAREIHEKAVEEKREMTQEEQNNYDKAITDFRTWSQKIEEADRAKEIERNAQMIENDEARSAAYHREIPMSDEQVKKDKELRSKFAAFLRAGTGTHMEEEYRALQQDNATQAGYLVAPESFMAEIIQNLYRDTFMRKIAKVLPPLNKADSLGVPSKTANMNSFAWGAEIGAPNPDATLAFGKREFKPKPATAEILVSKTLIRNAAVNVDEVVRDEFSHEMGEGMESGYMTGTGANQPLGVFTASNDGISTSQDVSDGNSSTEIKFDGLINAKYKITKVKYWPGLKWIFHPDAIKMIAKIKNGTGDYVWRESVKEGEPDRLLGFPVFMSEFAPSTFTSGSYVGALGNFKEGYWIVDSLNMEIQALFELYARTNQVDYIARIETDGAPVKEECFARVKLA